MRKVWIFHSSDELYGSDRVLLQIVQALDPREWEVRVILPADLPHQSGLSQKLRELHVPVQSRPLAVLRRRYQNLPGLLKLGWLLLRSVPTLAWEMRRHQLNLVYTNTGVVLSGAVAAKLARTRHIWGLKEYLPPGHLKAILARLYYLFSWRITVTSQAVSRNLSHIYPKCAAKVKIIFNSVDTAYFKPNPAAHEQTRAELGLDEDFLVCGMLGRVTQSKGPEVFIKAAQLLNRNFPLARFLIVGGPVPGSEAYLADLRKLVQEAGLGETVRFINFQSDIIPMLNALDIVVMPSLRPEGFGLTLVEAMAAGCPVVAANHGGPLEIVQSGVTGLLYNPPADAQALADCLAQLLADPKLREQMGQRGRARVLEYFSRETEAAAYRQLFSAE